MKVREPVARPLDIVAVELLLSASQAFLVGVLMYLAVGVWDDRGVGLGSVAVILVLLGLGVGGAWLYWLLGGVGWPMAAANVPVALFIGASLVLGWFGDELIRVDGAPLLVATVAAVFGILAGVFLDSPRRWRWDQREKLRPGTKVPRVSPTTAAIVAQVPRSLPRRGGDDPTSDLAARIEGSTPPGAAGGGDVGSPYVDGGDASADGSAREELDDEAPEPAPALPADDQLTDAPEVEGTEISAGSPGRLAMPTERLQRGASESGITSAADDAGDKEAGAIELPTSIEPKAQRSPWAWAAPPEWNRDEDDEGSAGRSSKRS